jgi:hypothetical protein
MFSCRTLAVTVLPVTQDFIAESTGRSRPARSGECNDDSCVAATCLTADTCIGSTCLTSDTCIGSTCLTSDTCIGSTCLTSDTCIGSTCLTSDTCIGSTCIGSSCVGSTCLDSSGCGDSGCGDSGCGETGCGETGCGITGCEDTSCLKDSCGEESGCIDTIPIFVKDQLADEIGRDDEGAGERVCTEHVTGEQKDGSTFWIERASKERADVRGGHDGIRSIDADLDLQALHRQLDRMLSMGA